LQSPDAKLQANPQRVGNIIWMT